MKLGFVVEGHGEVEAVPILIRRIAAEERPEALVRFSRVVRIPRTKLVQREELRRAVRLSWLNNGSEGCVLVIIDADGDCPKELAEAMLGHLDGIHGPDAVGIVIAKEEFEAWYIAGADSLRGRSGLPDEVAPHPDPETVRDAKGWLSRAMPGSRKYSETIDQPALAGFVDLSAAMRTRSFQKLKKEVLRLIDAGLAT